MNIHPIFVHFPIALLTIYAFLEILCVDRWYPKIHWDSVKTLLLVVGSIGAGAALITGSMAEDLIRASSTRAVVHKHETFAYATTIIFGVLALVYLIDWIAKNHPAFFAGILKPLPFLVPLSEWFLKRWVKITLALLGFIVLTITGALGGSIVYGPNADPVVQAVYSYFFQ